MNVIENILQMVTRNIPGNPPKLTDCHFSFSMHLALIVIEHPVGSQNWWIWGREISNLQFTWNIARLFMNQHNTRDMGMTWPERPKTYYHTFMSCVRILLSQALTTRTERISLLIHSKWWIRLHNHTNFRTDIQSYFLF